MKIRDDNTLEDIRGLILTLCVDVSVASPEFPVGPRFDELVMRIEDKLNRNSNATRANWFSIAHSHAKEAKSRFEGRETSAAENALRKCWEHLESGNKAPRRKAAFIVAPNGTVHPK